MPKFLCAECSHEVDDVICPVCGNPTESLSFDESTPDGKSDRYDTEILQTSGEVAIDDVPLDDLDLSDDVA